MQVYTWSICRYNSDQLWQTFLKLTWEFLAKKAQVAWKNGKMLLLILFCYHIKQQNLIKSQSKIPLNCYSLASQLQNGLNVWDTPCQKPSQNVPQMKKSFNYKDFFALFPVRRCPSNQSWIRSLNSFKNSWYAGREAGILPSLISSYLANFDNSFSSPSVTGFTYPSRVFKTLLTTRTLRSLRSLVAFTSRRSLSTLVTFRPLGPLEAVRPRRTRRPREAGRSTSSLRPGRTWGATRDVSWALNKEAGIWGHFCLKFLWAGRWIGVWCYISFVAIANTSMVQWCCSFRDVLVFK